MTACVALLAAIPLVRGEPWEKFAVFYTDPEKTATFDLTGKAVASEIRWSNSEQAVDVEVTDPPGGAVKFSLTADETELMPLGQIPTMFIAVDDETWARAPIDVQEGYSNE